MADFYKISLKHSLPENGEAKNWQGFRST